MGVLEHLLHDPILQNLLENESYTNIIETIMDVIKFGKEIIPNKEEKVTSIAANPRRALAQFSIAARRPDKYTKFLYNFDAFSNVRFTLSKGKPVNVFALYSKNDNIVSSEDKPEKINFEKLVRRSMNGNEYIYEFKKDYIYSSRKKDKVKPFIIFIQTKSRLHVCFIIMKQNPQAVSQAQENGSLLTRPTFIGKNPVVTVASAFQADFCRGFLEQEIPHIREQFDNEFEVAETLKLVYDLKNQFSLGFIKI